MVHAEVWGPLKDPLVTFRSVSLASCCRDRRDRHRSKSRDGSRGDKSVTIQAPGEPLLDNESTRGDERVSTGDKVV